MSEFALSTGFGSFFVFVLGAVLGSFLNVVIYRLPRAESLLRPPSHCFSCGARLRFWDLIPVLSYLWLRGRCRYCGASFSPRYALVEAASGLLAVASVQLYGPTLFAGAVFVVCMCLIAIFFIDWDYMIIPDELVALIAGLGLLQDGWAIVKHQAPLLAYADPLRIGLGEGLRTFYWPSSLIGMLVGAGLLLFLGWIFEKITGKPSMGGGDVKLAGAMGAWLGPGYLFVAYFIFAVVAGAVVGVIAMAVGKRGRRDYIPFGPMLSAAGIAMMLWGDLIGPWILRRFGG